MVDSADKMTADVAELWNRVKSGQREGHYYVALFGMRRYDPVHLVDQIQRGFTYAVFERFQRNTELPYRLLAQSIEIPERTLARRKESGRFEPDETDRLVRMSRVFARAIELFEGNADSAREWLTGPVRALGGRTPLAFATTDVGAIEVENLIGRLEYGIPTQSMRLWRLVKTKYASTAFDGEGARLHGGRWNSPGTRVAYASSNSALAVLEVLVHMTSGGILPGYSLVVATLPDALVHDLPTSELPRHWTSSPVPPELQAIGDAWARSGRSVALRVPSAVVPGSHNILINVEHAAFAQFVVESSDPFSFDSRLLR